jgi:hypothetical protein
MQSESLTMDGTLYERDFDSWTREQTAGLRRLTPPAPEA